MWRRILLRKKWPSSISSGLSEINDFPKVKQKNTKREKKYFCCAVIEIPEGIHEFAINLFKKKIDLWILNFHLFGLHWNNLKILIDVWTKFDSLQLMTWIYFKALTSKCVKITIYLFEKKKKFQIGTIQWFVSVSF